MRALALVFVASPAFADGLIPGPGEPGSSAALHDLAARYDRQFHTFNASPFGVSLDADVPIDADRNLIAAFLAQTAVDDFASFAQMQGTPRTVADVIASFGEHGDLGMFGGVPAGGEAFRYMVLRDGGAPPADVDRARLDLLDAIASFHVYTRITGEPGTIARGIRLATEPGPAPVPLPSCGDAWDRSAVEWRSDQSGQNPGWYFMDNTSKDQLIGYVFAIGAFWDAVAEDPSIAQSVKDDLAADALAMGQSMMAMVEVRPGTSIDLVIRDWQGCLVRFHDVNPREIVLDGSPPLVLAETSANRVGFNALVALSTIRTLYHVSGDAALRSFYYDELVTARGYPAVITSGAARLRQIFANTCVGGNCVVTNFSNVNMAFTSIYGLLRYETDPALRATYQAAFDSDLWSAARPHMGLEIQQAFFNLLYAGFKPGASDAAQAANAGAQLEEWPVPPYWDPLVENCDAGELAAGSCIAIDNTTVITLDSIPSRGGAPASVTPLPKRLRRPNNFEWRSDPRVVNGGGGTRLNPGGDFRASYWMGRHLSATTDTLDNVSAIARNRDGSGGPMMMTGMDAGVADTGMMGADAATDASVEADAGIEADAATPPDAAIADGGEPMKDSSVVDTGLSDAGTSEDPGPTEESGCGCTASSTQDESILLLLLMVFASMMAMRRSKLCNNATRSDI